ncbi:hypothetical protein LEP1GSC075_3407 [Leptospira interrogans str. Kito]|nr:hypothetical protein LEP1GSC069_0641 [Leptospira interrogans serovar Canicola str. Fiocruz LV133]EMK18359.1 hypothetical protein LEP1GSC075_3407 [Leptospira interrogans str. Kito]EMN74151.1 hypothetical protein LEP1GSC102_0544 [Leptospira interrogans str. UI 09600]
MVINGLIYEKIVVFKKYRKFGIYDILKQDQNIQIFETI